LAMSVQNNGDFGDVALNSSADRVITLQNIGTRQADDISNGTYDPPFTVVSDLCPASLPIGQTCTMKVRFTPSKPGAAQTQFTVAYTSGIGSAQVSSLLKANGVVPVQISANGEHTCGLNKTGQVKCWGYNRYGELGLGDTRDRGENPGEMGDNLPAV